MPDHAVSAVANRLLQHLPPRDRARLIDAGERVRLEFAEVVCAPGQRVEHAYFPLDCFISVLSELDGGAVVEVGMAGHEGMFGTDLVLDVEVSAVRGIVQGAGQALCVPAAALRSHLAASVALRRLMSRYAAVWMAQVTRTAACNGFHLIEQRLARWLLMCADRSGDGRMHLTQRFLAYMLGVRRAGVTKAASGLQQRQLIDYARGRISIRNREGLERLACSCYHVDRENYARVLGFPGF